MRVYGGGKLAVFINRNMTEVVLKKGREENGGDGGGSCGEVQSDRAPLFLGTTSSVCLAKYIVYIVYIFEYIEYVLSILSNLSIFKY